MKICISLKPYSLILEHIRSDNLAYMAVKSALKIEGVMNILDDFGSIAQKR